MSLRALAAPGILVTGLAVGLLAAGPADAAPATLAPAVLAPAGDGPVGHDVSVTVATQRVAGDDAVTRALDAHWTSSRMSSATALDPRSGRAATTGKAPAPTAAPKTVKPLRVKGGGQPRSVGRLFFEWRGDDYWCSAAVVNTAKRNLIATAGHCAAQEGIWSKNVVFVPAYRDGKAPYGKWAARSLTADSGWLRRGDLDYDYSFAVMRKLKGRDLASVVGAQGIDWNAAKSVSVKILGYPVASKRGQRMASCSSKTRVISSARDGIARHRFSTCKLNGGSSGGPWLSGYSSASGTGYLVGVQSLLWFDSKKRAKGNSSPFLGSTAYDLYRYAQKI